MSALSNDDADFLERIARDIDELTSTETERLRVMAHQVRRDNDRPTTTKRTTLGDHGGGGQQSVESASGGGA